MSVAAKLKELNVALPPVTAPVANYVPAVIAGNLLYISGQLPLRDGQMTKGHLGAEVTIEQGYEAAKTCALNIVAQAAAALGGDLERVVRCVRLGGFISCTPEFVDHPKIVNGASDFIVSVFGDKGRHARTSIGVSSLPLGAAVEVEALFEIKP